MGLLSLLILLIIPNRLLATENVSDLACHLRSEFSYTVYLYDTCEITWDAMELRVLDNINGVLNMRKHIKTDENGHRSLQLTLTGLRLGKISVMAQLAPNSFSRAYSIAVIQRRHVIDVVFTYSAVVFVLISSFVMGALLEYQKCKDCLQTSSGRKAALACLVSQWLFPVPIAIGVSKLFRFSDLQSSGLFAIACSPIGTKSQQWTVILDGDVNLSVVLTFLSTICSFFVLPIWTLILAQLYTRMSVPFLGLLKTLLCVIVPYVLALLITYWKPSFRDWAKRYCKGLLIVALVFFMTVGIYASWPMFKQLHYSHALSAPLVQWIACVIGYLLASIVLRLAWHQAITFALSVGYSNIGVAFLLVRYNFEQPESDIASSIVLVVAATASIALWVLFCAKRTKQRFFERKRKLEEPVPDNTTTEEHNIMLNSALSKKDVVC